MEALPGLAHSWEGLFWGSPGRSSHQSSSVISFTSMSSLHHVTRQLRRALQGPYIKGPKSTCGLRVTFEDEKLFLVFEIQGDTLYLLKRIKMKTSTVFAVVVICSMMLVSQAFLFGDNFLATYAMMNPSMLQRNPMLFMLSGSDNMKNLGRTLMFSRMFGGGMGGMGGMGGAGGGGAMM